MNHIELVSKINNINIITDSINQTITTCNDQNLFNLKILKNQRKENLRNYFKKNRIEKIYLTQRINKLEPENYKLIIEILPDDFFLNKENIEEKINKLKNSIVIFNNNDIHINAQTIILDQIITHAKYTIFCAWDWDNHHWLNLSCKLASIVDLYFPSHNENLYQLSRFNDSATYVTPCATVQWSEKYLKEKRDQIINNKRKNDLLGMHIFYPSFYYRTSVIKTISETNPSVGFRDSNFHYLSDEIKLKEWISHKIHLIVPVLNDLPIRIFDTWCTGGIPLLPKSLEGSIEHFNISKKDIAFYGNNEILNLSDILEKTINLFDNDGIEGIIRRVNLGMRYHHGNCIIKRILEIAQDEYGFKYK